MQTDNLPDFSAIPETLNRECHRVTAQVVARYMRDHDLAAEAPAGKCRFCRRDMPMTHVGLPTLHGPAKYPVLQCNHAAKLHGEACKINEQWRAELKAQASAKPAKKGYEL